VSIARWNLKGLRRSTGPQSMGKPKMNRSARGGAKSSLHYRGEGVLIYPPHQGVCGRHGTEEQRVTSGELAESPGGNRHWTWERYLERLGGSASGRLHRAPVSDYTL
jgi:hypothetical protein